MKKSLWTQGLLALSVALLMTACGEGAGNGDDDPATNRAPIAAGQNITTNEDTAKNITLTGTDADGDPLTYIVIADPVHGSLSGTAPDVTYTPNAEYHGSDSFTFKVNDGTVDSAEATVRITVVDVNDAPVAGDQDITTDKNTAKNITLTGTDADGDPLTYTVTADPVHGSLGGVAPNLTYTPDVNYHGADSFKFKVNDGTVDSAEATVRIIVNTTPTASDFSGTLDVNETLLSFAWKNVSQAADADGDALSASLGSVGRYGDFSVSGDTLTYRKTIEGHAADTAELIISDGKASVSVTVRIAALYWQQVATGHEHSAAIKSDGSLWLWGRNHRGQIGDGMLIDRLVPVHVTVDGNPTWKQVSAGTDYTLAVEDDGTLWVWGWNIYGQLGIGSNVDQKKPVEIVGSTWKQVSAGGYHVAGIQSNDTLWAWGYNHDGQLGDSTHTDRNISVKISNAAWKQVSAGRMYTVGILSDDTLRAWGNNRYGQLGDGTQIDKNTSVKIGNADWEQVSAGGQHTVGVQMDGTLWTWGHNRKGQLGDGTEINRNAPVQIGGDTWKQTDGGGEYTVAIRNGGKLFAWGANDAGQLGDGTDDSHRAPVPIGDASWAQIAAGGYHSLGIRSDGTLWAWGWNGFGQLGDGTTTRHHSPVPVYGRGL